MIVSTENKTLYLKSRDPMLIKETIPRSKIVSYEGHNIAVYHGVDEVQILRNMHIKAPSPIYNRYCWSGPLTPFKHQKETAAFLTMNRKAFVFNEMGLGKSASVLWAADFLMEQNALKKVLIIAPLSTLERVWHDEISKLLMHRSVAILHGTKETRLKRLAMDVDFYVINHDGLPTIQEALAKRTDIDLVVIDEASVYRNHGTERYKKLKKTLKPDNRLWLLTGTPCPNAPTDAWALAKLVSPANVPEFYGSFQRQTMVQVSQHGWAPRHDAYDTAFNALQPAVRYKKSECLDLPPVLLSNRECEITQAQKRAYADMKSALSAQFAGQTISAVNAADALTKLRQILSGVVKVPDSAEYVEIDHAPRVALTLECIEECASKVIVIVPFKGVIRSLYDKISKHHSCAILNGDVSIAKRNIILTNFRDTKEPHVLLCHPKVMSHGLNLTEASMIIFYAPIYSNDEYQQVKDRINRPGQKLKMTIVRIAGSRLEWQIYKKLDTKELTQESILELFNNEVMV